MTDGPACLILLKATCLALLLGMGIGVFPGSAAAHGDPRHETASSSGLADRTDMPPIVVDECCHLDGLCIAKVLPGTQAQVPAGILGTMVSSRFGRQVPDSLSPAAEPPPPRF